MKKLIYLFSLLFLFIGCGEDAKKEIELIPTPQPSEPDKSYDYSVFSGYHVKDTAGFNKETIVLYSSNDTVWLFGLKNHNPWFGMFDFKTKEQLSEWVSATNPSLGGTSAINLNPILLSEGYVFFLRKTEFTYIPFLLKKGGDAIPFNEYTIYQNHENLFIVREIEDNILIFHPDSPSNVYSKSGEIVVNSIAISEKQDDGVFYLSGFKQDRTWFCACLNDEEEQQYVGAEPYDRNIRLHLGYGEYEDCYVKTLPFDEFRGRFIVTDWGYVYAPALGDRGVPKDLFLCKERKMECIEAPLSYFTLHNWYKGTFLVYATGSVVGSVIKYTIYSSDKNIVLKYEKIYETYVDPFRSGDISPCPLSYDEYIWNENWGGELRIRRYSLQSSATSPIWQQIVGKVSENSKVSWTLLDNQSSIWLYRIDVLNYDGSSQQIKFSVDINTGDIKNL